jgi:tetratricopeptide (TPR) repeat protein
MRILKRPIVIISLVVIAAATYYWQAYMKPASGVLYSAAVGQYQKGNYEESLELLKKAHRINPLDNTILSLCGWNYLKLRNLPEAREYFGRAARFSPRMYDARLGLAYTYLELGENSEALRYFRRLPLKLRDSREVQVAMAQALRLEGKNQQALEIVKGVLTRYPDDALGLKQLAYLTGASDLSSLAAIPAPQAARPPTLVVAARLKDGYFQVPVAGGWQRIYIAGVNLGPAKPGHFATEPPEDPSVYLEWMNQIGEMGANSLRVYTLLPPAFYRALLTYNLDHPQSPLYLFQETWLDDPPLDNLLDSTFTADFESECRTVVDALHGQADIPFRRGHASGIYSVDVSPYVLGWLVGREVEPRVVITTNLRNPGVKSFEGHYLKIVKGDPAEVWLTRMCDAVVNYEVSRYNRQRPVCFVNWPPLDPLTHPTEARLADELRIRREHGEKIAPLGLGVQDDFDVVSLDEEKVAAQPTFQAGYFALYHLYPFWPDFVFLDPVYRKANDGQGLNSYWGYLTDLKKHLQHTPLLVGEYGLSTSLGIAHFNPNGWNHGGLSEVEQGQILVRLTDDIQKAGCAGGMVFEWIDEWWKHNWISVDFEQPFDRNALWHNDMDPEQFFGLSKFVPNPPADYTTLAEAEQSSATAPSPPAAAGLPLVRSIQTAADPSALYVDLVLDLPAGTQPDWSRDSYMLALNTCDAPCGSNTVSSLGVRVVEGANFLVQFTGPLSSRLLVAHSYNPYRETPVGGDSALQDMVIPRNMTTSLERGGQFEEMIIETNRRRYGRDGTFYPAVRYSRSLLRFGSFDLEASDYDSLAQCYFDSRSSRIRLRLSWGLLLVLDPSQGLVLGGTDGDAKPTGELSRQIRMAVIAYSTPEGSTKGVPRQFMAKRVSGRDILECWSMPWPTWRAVRSEARLKQSYAILRAAFHGLTEHPSVLGGR